MSLLCTVLIAAEHDAARPIRAGSGTLEVVHMGPKRTSGLREAIDGDGLEPMILCARCKHMTPLSAEHCASCGARITRPGTGARPVRPLPELAETEDDAELEAARRSLLQLFEDLQRVYDVSSSPADAEDATEPPILFQCPACGRFVAEEAASCLCGAKFVAEEAHVQYACPRCGALVAPEAESCRCGVRFSG